MKRLCLCLCVFILLVSCGDPAGDGTSSVPQTTETTTEAVTEHVHDYTVKEVEPTVSERGYTVSACECGDTSKEYATGYTDGTETLNILFVGNSYTYYNDMPTAIFYRILKAQGFNARVYSVTKGGHTLQGFADSNDTYGKQLDTRLASVDFDVIFIQEQSVRPAQLPALFYESVRQLSKKLEGENADVIMYQTWGRKEPNSTLTSNGWTNRIMTQKLAAAYEAIADEMGYGVSAVGSAFYDVYTNHPEIELYTSDMSHPSDAGSYLAALCHYAKLYGLSPVGVSFTSNLDENTAKVLQEAAHNAVFGESIVEDEFRASSVGVSVDTSLASGMLTKAPDSDIISVRLKGDKGKFSSTAVTSNQLTDKQKADLADIGYGISIIGTKDMVRPLYVANDGVWSNSNRLSYHFDGKHYGIAGNEDENERYSALITLNFGKTVTLDAIGYCSGNTGGFSQAQDVFVSDDGVTWAKIESACYDVALMNAAGKTLYNISDRPKDSAGKTSSALVLFDMGGVKAKYIRIGVVTGVTANDWDMNTLELVVYGSDK